jgi:hypothetical protein
MTQESQDAVAGQVAREYAAASREIAVLEAELAKMQDMYYRLAYALHRDILIRFDDEPDVESPPVGFRKEEYRFSSEEISGTRLKLLCNDLKAMKVKLADLEKRKRDLGI